MNLFFLEVVLDYIGVSNNLCALLGLLLLNLILNGDYWLCNVNMIDSPWYIRSSLMHSLHFSLIIIASHS